MRSFLSCAVLAVLLAAVLLAADISGNWTGTMAMGDNQFTLTYTFKQDGDKLTGTVVGPQGDPLTINDGRVQGAKLTFNVTVETPNGTMKIMNEGDIKSEEEITLTSTMQNAPEGAPQFPPMTLKRSK